MKYEPKLYKLSNGIPVIIDPMDLETTNVRILFKTGARDEQPNEYGITHFAEHMLNKGTPRFPNDKDTNDYFDYHGGWRNASTSNDTLAFYGRIVAENVNVLIDFLGDTIQNSLFLPEKIETERKAIADELRRALDDENRKLWYFKSGNLFPNSGLAHHTLGTMENIQSFSREQMLEFLSRRLSAKNCIVGISGKINDVDGILKQLEKSLAWLPDFDVSENNEIKYNPIIAHNPLPDKKNIKLRIYFPNIWDYSFEHRFNRASAGRFNRFMGKELYEIIRNQNGLAYGFGNASIGNETFGLHGFATSTGPENIEKVVAMVAKNAFRIYNENAITDEDLDRYERKDRLGDCDWLESASSRCNKLIGFYRDYGQVYDFHEALKMFASIRREDAIQNSRGLFDGKMSIITQGADFNADLGTIWKENFK